MQSSREPILNVPPVIIAILAVLIVVHVILTYALTRAEYVHALLLFSFIPARYEPSLLPVAGLPGGTAADLWTFVTYALIHGGWNHLFFNGVWLLAFGTPLARRFGPTRFLVFMALSAAAGAVVHLLFHSGEFLPMVGASAAISGAMGASIRFIFQVGGPLGIWRHHDGDESYRVPAASLIESLRDPRVLAFLAVWFGINLLFGLGSVGVPGGEQAVAWEAHIGGFLAGLLAFAAFDPSPSATGIPRRASSDR